MSQMIPKRLTDTLRQFNDISVGLYGIDCTLNVPRNWDTVVNADDYVEPTDYTFDTYQTQVWIEWTPQKHKLLKYGLFAEGASPILAYFSNKILDSSGFAHDVDIKLNSWFSIPIEYIPSNIDADSFEIVDVLIPSMHDSVVMYTYVIVPRRTKVAGGRD